MVSAKNDASKRVSYGELVGARVQRSAQSHGEAEAAGSVDGSRDVSAALDLPAAATAQLEYVQNVRVPGMLHGRVVRPPAVGAKLVGVDESSIRDLPGIVKVVVKANFVGVVAEKPWQAIQAANKLKATWTPGAGLPSHRDFYEYMRKEKASRDTLLVNSKDVDAKLASASSVVKATYLHPYQMHGSIGTSCAVADVRGNGATIWSATQSVYPQRNSTAMLLGLPPENVRVIFTRGSGCYGLNGADTVSYDAALLSQAVDRPVRVQLMRKDEMAWENYGFAFVIDQRAGLNADGDIIAWDYEGWSPALGNRPGNEAPGNVVTGFLAGFQPAAFVPRTPAPDPADRFNNGNNSAPSYVAGCVGDACRGSGTIKSERVLSHRLLGPFWTGPLRSPERLQNTFAHESFMDEIAAHAKADPVAYRLRHLSNRRIIDVVKAAAQAARWDPRPSPRPGIRKTGTVSGQGIACVGYEGENGYSAMVAKSRSIRTGNNRGEAARRRPGLRPDLEPRWLEESDRRRSPQGLSRALVEEVMWDDQKVTSVDWKTYRTMDLGSKSQIETVLINGPTRRRRAQAKRRLRSSRRPSAMRSSTPRALAFARFRLLRSG